MKKLLLSFALIFSAFPLVKAQSGTLRLVESSGGCGLATDCAVNRVCYDILLTIDQTLTVQSYNIFVTHDEPAIGYLSDNACLTNNGGDTDITDAYRVAGIQGTTATSEFTAGVERRLHTICFSYTDVPTLDAQTLTVGGSQFAGALRSVLTFSSGVSINFPTAVPLELSGTNTSCILAFPVELLSFDVTKSGKDADLDWVTAQELNSSHFEVERSMNEGMSYEKVGMVNASGHSQTASSYSYLDKDIAQYGVNRIYYRLKMVDMDGSSEYSNYRVLTLDGEDIFVSLYPNPASGSVNINYSSNNLVNGVLTVYNDLGQLVYEQKLSEGNGAHQETLDISRWTAGIYHVQIADENHTITKKLVVE